MRPYSLNLLRRTVLMSFLCLSSINALIAHAGIASASYSSLTYQLTDLDASDGIAPVLTWTSGSAASGVETGTSTSQVDSKDGIFPSTEVNLGTIGASSSTDSAAAFAVLTPAITSSAFSLIEGRFRLTPHTEVTFSALGRVELNGGRRGDSAKVTLNVFTDSDTYGEGHAIELSSPSDSAPFSATRRLFFSLTNDASDETENKFGARASVIGIAIPVPEPGAYLFMVAAACIAGWIHRRKENVRYRANPRAGEQGDLSRCTMQDGDTR
jgi:hypothetical protein